MFEQIKQKVEAEGLLIRSAFHTTPDDSMPLLDNAEPAATLLLIGNAGSAMWEVFSRSAEYLDSYPDSLDRWSERIGKRLAEEFGGAAFFPFGGPPFHPFLSWAKCGEPSETSPLGLSLHPEYGLWHAYRFALGLPQRLDLSQRAEGSGAVETQPESSVSAHPCAGCDDKPCLSACPVGAFTGSEYRHVQCAQFLADNANYECNQLGCGSRRACPIGQNYRYKPEHAQFHMDIFVSNHARKD